MWQDCGAEVVEMAVDHHDQVLAATSHLPHLLAYTLVDTLVEMDDQREVFEYAAGGFRDFTRIASSDPALWRDISMANADALLAMVERFQCQLQQVADAIRAGDDDELLAIYRRAQEAREHFAKLIEAR
jgi:prephenate dehydrogenase